MRLVSVVSALMLCFPVAHIAAAQVPAGQRAAVAGIGEIHGTLTDSASGRPVASGSVTIRRASDSVFAGGALPKPDGTFRVDGLPPGRYTLRVRALGFAQLARNGIVISVDKPVVDVGTLALNTVATRLAGEEVVAERDDQVLAPDRNSYSTKNMTTVSGGTAVDVLRNIPSVEVDGSNKVSLRGNENVVIQINGRSSPLKGEQLGAFLAQLPANTVKNVEVATNPSAKNDPEGTAGIINIVLNQDAELGLSGGINAGTSTTGQVSLSGNVGKQQGPLTVFLSGSVNHDQRVSTGTISRTNLVVPVPVYVETSLDGRQRPLSGGGTIRSEYRFTEQKSLTFDGYFYGGRFGANQQSSYTDLNATRDVIGRFNQFTDQTSRNFSQDYDVAFHHQGKPTEMQLNAEIEYSYNYNTNEIDLSGIVTQHDASTPASIASERDHTVGTFPSWTTKFDYTQPFGQKTKLEAGFKGTQRVTANDFNASYLMGAAYVLNPSRTTAFDYRENVGAAYAVLSQSIGSVQAQTGLRLEDVGTRLDLPLSSIRLDNSYRSAYPSAILSYNFNPLRQAKVSYSRRVSRPYPGALSPIEYRQDTRNVFRGNPNLRPEYTDAFELNLLDAHPWGSLQVNPYVRHTGNAVRNIQFVDSTGVTVTTFANVASTMVVGSDLNATLRHGALTLFGGGSVYHYGSDASNIGATYSTHTVVWSLRANTTWKISPVTDAQFFANYRAPAATEGGTQLASVFMNGALRYKAWGDQGSISLRVSDPFGLSKFGYRLNNGTVIESSERYFNQRALFLTISRNFGQQVKLRPKSDPDPQAAVGAPGPP